MFQLSTIVSDMYKSCDECCILITAGICCGHLPGIAIRNNLIIYILLLYRSYMYLVMSYKNAKIKVLSNLGPSYHRSMSGTLIAQEIRNILP